MTIPMRFALTCFAAALALGLPAAAPAAAEAARPAPVLRVEPFEFELRDGTKLAAERGRFSVPEDRLDPGSRRIEIGFVRFRSTNPRPGPPIVYLAGGPGGSGVDAARGERQPLFLALRQVADVIALDQRGVGMSNHIPGCTAERGLNPGGVLNEQMLTAYYRETFRTCVERWRAAGVAVGGYDTEQNADDLEDLRRALGARRIDLWGISYGTHLALAAMRRHPDSIGRVALASAEGMDQTAKLPASVDAAFARIEAAAGTPLTQLMRRVHARFDAAPQSFEFRAQDGNVHRFASDSFPLRMMAGFVAKNPDGIARLAGAYAAMDAGHLQPVAPLIWDFFLARPLTMTGMPELTDVASGVSAGRMRLLDRQSSGSLLGRALNFPMPQLRGAVAGLELEDGFRSEVVSRHPVLLLSGDLDVRTPMEEQQRAAARLRNVRRIVVRNGGHDLFEAHPDVPRLLGDFFSGRDVPPAELRLPMPSGERPRAGGEGER